MNKHRYMIVVVLLGMVTVAFAAAGDRLYRSSGDFIIKAGNYIKITTALLIDKTPTTDGSTTTPGWVPIGGMLAIMPSTSSLSWQPPATGVIKDGFMRADGNQVPPCPDCGIPAGTTLPNLTSGKFLRGNTSSTLTPSGGTLTLGQATIPAVSSSATLSGTQSVGHTHSTAHGHSTNITDGNNQGHTHSASHSHGYSIGDDTVNHIHSADLIDGSGVHQHTFTNGSGESINVGWSPAPPTAVFQLGLRDWFNAPNANHFIGTAAGSHTHTFTWSKAGTHSHTSADTTNNAPTNVNSSSHAHAAISYTGSASANDVDHTHGTSLTFNPGVTPVSVDTEPTNIEVIWVIRVR